MPGEEFPTTNEDLAGFWDMVMLQVVQVNELFDQIEKLRKSQWQEVSSEFIVSIYLLILIRPSFPMSAKEIDKVRNNH